MAQPVAIHPWHENIGNDGYGPSEPDSAACLLSSHAPTKPVARLSDLHGLMQAAVSETTLGREAVD